ncbi:hypothetical protein CQ12_13875 [Bradyrhizobium jicamae]|uniref:Uncharacterized protein n=1 Tax=Bradyrhizobium jicamae TaxID=280332 RepID=A0A0R3LWY7_9BRAD|nr:hypothetical protein [Bradyrhizobium jicamae]KRR09571.1 hypothetical protein CQ12_13875 [Bradyrhizobium jicamae]
MNKIATIDNNPKPGKVGRISRRVRHAVDLLASGECKTQKAAAERAGLSPERLCRALKEVKVQEYRDRQTRVSLANASITAAATLNWLLEHAKSEHCRKDVAVTLLGYSGVHANPTSGPVVNIGIGGGVGYVIDLSGPGDTRDSHPMLDVTPNREGER